MAERLNGVAPLSALSAPLLRSPDKAPLPRVLSTRIWPVTAVPLSPMIFQALALLLSIPSFLQSQGCLQGSVRGLRHDLPISSAGVQHWRQDITQLALHLLASIVPFSR